MANFVASDSNLAFLGKQNLILDDLVKKFADAGMFFNIAADFNKRNDAVYKKCITRYMTEEDWGHIHGCYPSKGMPCDAANSFFSVAVDGTITSCGAEKHPLLGRKVKSVSLGNFFEGKLRRKPSGSCPRETCRSIVSYAHRRDNGFLPFRHLEDYIKRNTQHRKKQGVL